jgi:Ni/Fe-hydrogenase 1 B-type cytochrome subunit
MFAVVSSQQLRLLHHGVMWLILAFVTNHIYSAVLMDAKEHGGEISSIFSGYKFILRKEE